jgi:peptidylprolyl isomerase domain and WD repeat-containing protein 1
MIISTIDESTSFYINQQLWSDSSSPSIEEQYQCDRLDFERRLAMEKEVDKSLENNTIDICFDEEDQVIIYASMMGVKVISWKTHKLLSLMGKHESERFTKLALY